MVPLPIPASLQILCKFFSCVLSLIHRKPWKWASLKLRKRIITPPACFTTSFFFLKDNLLLSRFLMNLWQLFSTCIWRDIKRIFSFKVFRAIQKCLSSGHQNQFKAQLCSIWGKEINGSRRDRNCSDSRTSYSCPCLYSDARILGQLICFYCWMLAF